MALHPGGPHAQLDFFLIVTSATKNSLIHGKWVHSLGPKAPHGVGWWKIGFLLLYFTWSGLMENRFFSTVCISHGLGWWKIGLLLLYFTWSGLMENGFAATIFEITNKVENKDEHMEKWNLEWGSRKLNLNLILYVKHTLKCLAMHGHLPIQLPRPHVTLLIHLFMLTKLIF